ncbi:MAG: hybrid sensor histidine kinase/response regulator [Alphaproteobacteria bacterium]|nr:hybrid sensor histidine kinase/response regulator [Alphaproteobacteria bacterium]
MTLIPNPAAQIAIFAPHGRDAGVAGAMLREAGIDAVVCADMPGLENALNDELGAAVVTEEAIATTDLRKVAVWLHQQKPWSDLPFIILTQRGGGPEFNPEAARLSGLLGNVIFLERPFRAATFVSVVRTALRGRMRQYEMRNRMMELRESEERLHTALLAGRLGAWELEPATGQLDTSEMAKRIFGRAAEDAFTFHDMIASVHSDDRARVDAAALETFSTGQDFVIEHRILWPDGSLHWVDVRARLLRKRAGHRTHMVGVFSDITDRKAAEGQLRHMNELLEERVAQRTAELKAAHEKVLVEITQRERTEEQLRHSQKVETIGQLTGGIAHDFNNLLMAVLGNLDLLRKRLPDDPRITRLIDSAMQGAQRGAGLTQRLLAFAHRQNLTVEPTSLPELVGNMVDLITQSAGKKIELTLNLGDPGLPLVMVDANQIELALLNLVINARDAMQEKGTLSIEVDEQESRGDLDLAAGQYLRLAVTDTGHGMDEDTLRKATEPFFSTKGVGKGTGLGLSMVHGVAAQLHGALRLTSEIGKGTRAELWLPVTSATPVHKAVENARTPVEEIVSTSLTILVVDDDALIAMSTVDMLEDLGHRVIEANSGDKALGILQQRHDIDLLITDYSMPRMNGAQLAKAARDLQPDLPIIIATGYAELPSDSALDLRLLAKPYQQHDLAAEIGKILRGNPETGNPAG